MPVTAKLSKAFYDRLGEDVVTELVDLLNLVDETISWLSDPRLAMLAVITVVVWQGTPFFTMSFLAGLQAIPRGQFEAAMAVGLSYWQAMRLVVLPQALKITIPNIVSVLANLASFTILLLTPYYLGNTLGMTAGGIGLMMALAFVGGTAGAPLAARLAPRIGRRPERHERRMLGRRRLESDPARDP